MSLPVVIICLAYLIMDPFKVVYDYDIYCAPGSPSYISINRSMVSQKMFDKYHDFYHWNSYVFGGSRSLYFRHDIWQPYLDDTCSITHMDGFNESLYSVYHKIKYINGKTPIDNALLCIDEDLLYKTVNELEPLSCITPDLDPNFSYFEQQTFYLGAFMRKPLVAIAYTYYRLSGKVKPWVVRLGEFDTTIRYYDIRHNEDVNMIEVKNLPDSLIYNDTRMAMFYQRPNYQVYGQKVIDTTALRMLTEIKEIFEANNTDYKVIVNPTYNQKKLSLDDQQILESLFGDRLYDYSGVNFITQDYHNYSDNLHFRKHVARQILKWIYEDNAHTIPEGQTDFDKF